MIFNGKQIGGAELQFVEFANYISKRLNVAMFSLGGNEVIESVKIDECIDITIFKYDGKFGLISALAKAVLRSRKINPCIIVSTSFSANLFGLIIRNFTDSKLVSFQTVSKCMRYPTFDRKILKGFDIIIAGAKDVKRYLIEHGLNDRKIRVVRNWIDFSSRNTTKSSSEIREYYNFGDRYLIGCVARLHKQKGQIYLIKAIENLTNNNLLIFVGDGPEKLMLENEVSKLSHVNNVIFLGEIRGSEYNNLINSFDVLVLPSLYEGLPRVLLDGMYLQTPIVASDVNGIGEAIVDHKTGLLVPPGDSIALSNAIRNLKNDPQLVAQFVLNARNTVISSFDMNIQLSKLWNIIKDQ